MKYVNVILPLNLKGTFTYKVPEELWDKIDIGMRVFVSFRSHKIYTGIVEEVFDDFIGNFIPKEVINILDPFPILPKEQILFWQWLSEYYLSNIGEIYRFAFPSSLKLESETYLKLKNPENPVKWENLDENETYLLQALEVRSVVSLKEMEAFIPKKWIIKTINSLIDEQIIVIDEQIAEKYKPKEISYIRLHDEVVRGENLSQILSQLNKAPKQRDLLLTLLEHYQTNKEPVKKSEVLGEVFGNAHLKGLIQKGWVEEFYQSIDRINAYEGEIEELELLSEDQIKATHKIDQSFKENKNVLLHGVTSSGKTHIYLDQIDKAILQNKNILLILPEISLAKQITQRLEKKFGKNLAYYHAKLTDFEKVEVWKKIKNNEVKVLIGTKQALFLPFQKLGLIIVDEEHDNAYRQKDAHLYFNAKDAALVLGDIYQANVILGSATPSLESYYLAQKDKLTYIYLDKRFGEVDLPTFQLVDFGEEQKLKNVKGNFTTPLISEIQDTLEDKNQVIILHNRRGYANVVECESCGYVTYCSNCDVVMTYHKTSNEMKCHYCGQKAAKPSLCPKCHSPNINIRGVGIEKIEEEAKDIFTDAEVDRMDVDTMRKKFAYEKLYEKLESRETQILVGTQMISKGLDFDHIELVAIPRADSMLHVQDYRAEERAYQLITQVAGRAGRKSGKGRVVIQTFNPHQGIFNLIQNQNTEEIYQYFLEERKRFMYPPFVKTVLIELKHRKEEKLNRASQFLGSVLRKYLPEECIFGPEKSPIGRINLLYQYQVFLKFPRSNKYHDFKELLAKSLEEFDEITAYHSIKKDIFIDI